MIFCLFFAVHTVSDIQPNYNYGSQLLEHFYNNIPFHSISEILAQEKVSIKAVV